MRHEKLIGWLLALAFLLLPAAVRAQETVAPARRDPRPESAERAADTASVGVFFATNRNREEIEPQGVRFGGQRGNPGFGICEIEFNPIPFIDDVAPKVPFYVPSETNEVRIRALDDPDAFFNHLSSEVEKTTSRAVVVFVHGYSYDFERGCHRAAEMQRVLQGKATVLMFSWPSNGRPTDYVPDQADLEWSVPFLAELVELLADRLGPHNAHVLAHSLGARGVVLAVGRLQAERADLPVVGRLVFLAPDFDSETFVELLPGLAPAAQSITLYASSNDTPLKFSHRLHGAPRLGEAGEFLTVVEGMETVDVSPAGRYKILGHEYFLFHPWVAADLALLLSTGRSAANRTALRPRSRNGLAYWEVAAEDQP